MRTCHFKRGIRASLVSFFEDFFGDEARRKAPAQRARQRVHSSQGTRRRQYDRFDMLDPITARNAARRALIPFVGLSVCSCAGDLADGREQAGNGDAETAAAQPMHYAAGPAQPGVSWGAGVKQYMWEAQETVTEGSTFDRCSGARPSMDPATSCSAAASVWC